MAWLLDNNGICDLDALLAYAEGEAPPTPTLPNYEEDLLLLDIDEDEELEMTTAMIMQPAAVGAADLAAAVEVVWGHDLG